MERLSVAIVIVNWNGLSYTDECLKSLRSITYRNYQIILVDNGSTDGSRLFFRKHYPEMEIIENENNRGFSGGNNVGMQMALDKDFDYVLLLNNDTIIHEPDFLSKMVKGCETDAKIGMACPTIFYNVPAREVWYAGARLSLWTGWKHYYQKPEAKNVQSTGYTTGCCLLVKAKTIRDIGMLNDAYFLSMEDVEWSMRAKVNGWKTVYIPGPSILHKESLSCQSLKGGGFSSTRIYCGFRNRIWFIREYGNWFQKVAVWPCRLSFGYVNKAAGYVLLGQWEKLKAITQGAFEGIFTKSSSFKNNY